MHIYLEVMPPQSKVSCLTRTEMLKSVPEPLYDWRKEWRETTPPLQETLLHVISLSNYKSLRQISFSLPIILVNKFVILLSVVV